MKILNIKQRPDDEVVIRCHCGDDHFLVFTYSKFTDESWIGLDLIEAWRSPTGLFGRLKAMWQIFRHAEWCGASVGLNESDLDAIIEWCTKMKVGTSMDQEGG